MNCVSVTLLCESKYADYDRISYLLIWDQVLKVRRGDKRWVIFFSDKNLQHNWIT